MTNIKKTWKKIPIKTRALIINVLVILGITTAADLLIQCYEKISCMGVKGSCGLGLVMVYGIYGLIPVSIVAILIGYVIASKYAKKNGALTEALKKTMLITGVIVAVVRLFLVTKAYSWLPYMLGLR